MHRMTPRSLVLSVMLASLPVGLSAQERPPEARNVPGLSSLSFWTVSLSHPDTVAGRMTAILGKRRLGRIVGRGSTLRGLGAGYDIGPGGLSARIGWTDLFEYDAGVDGWSFEAVYVRPWLIQWGSRRGSNYIGGGLTRYFGFLRLSGAIVVDTSLSSHDVSPTATLGILLPFE